MDIKVKRIYETAGNRDGQRILVDRVWPRGISKEEAQLADWMKDVAPSDKLRKEFDHDPDKYDQFKADYHKELNTGEQKEAFEKLKEKIENHDARTTLLYGAKDEKHNQANILLELLEKSIDK